MSEYNAMKLHDELVNAGFNITGCNSNGVVWDDKGKEIQDQSAVITVLESHDPAPVEQETIEEMVDRKISEALSSLP